MSDFMFNDGLNIDEFGIIPIKLLTEEEQLIKLLLLSSIGTNAIFLEPLILENREILEMPKEYYKYNEDTNIETLEIKRGSMDIQDAIWYSATKTGLSRNPKMYSHRLHLAYPINKYFKNLSWHNKEKEAEKERLQQQEQEEREEREKTIAKEKELRYKDEVEFAARVMAHQESRRSELNHLATEETDKLGFLFKECGKMIAFMSKLPMQSENNNFIKNIVTEQSKNFNFAYQKFMKYIKEEKNKTNINEKVRTLTYSEN